MKSNILLVLLALPIFLLGQTSSENYVKVTTYQKATQDGTITSSYDAVESITYYDGLGRPIQEIGKKAGGQGQDIITPITYDAFGRQAKTYLPYANPNQVLSASSLAYRDNENLLDNNILSSYYQAKYPNDFANVQETNAYSEQYFEKSPLNRVLRQAAPGDAWKLSSEGDDHSIKMEYGTNTLDQSDTSKDNVRLLEVVHPLNNTELITLVNSDYYGAGTLYKVTTKDENWQSNQTFIKDHTTEEFKNKAGQVLLKRTYNAGVKHDTYYIYDDFGNLTYVIPPLVNINDGVSTDELERLCYQYRYDKRNRLIAKKIPAKAEEYIIYDLLDRPVLTQDSNLRASNQWLFTKYDVFGRVIYTGKITNSANRVALQNIFNANTTVYESRTANTNTIDGLAVYYSNANFPNDSSVELLTVNYYDDYLWTPQNSLEANYGLVYQGLVLDHNVISKVASDGWGNAGFTTDGKIENDGYIQYKVDRLNQPAMIGLSAINSAENHHYNTIDYAIYTGYGDLQRCYVFKEGVLQQHLPTTFEVGDIFKVERSGDRILFKKNNETFHAIETTYQGVLIGDGSILKTENKILSNVHIGYAVAGQTFGSAKGLPTGSLVRTLETKKWTTTIPYYDNKGRQIHMTSKNEYLNTKDAVSSTLDFTGKPTQKRTTHVKIIENQRDNPIVTKDEFVYDNMARLLYQTKNINDHGKELIAKNNYNELGQLKQKQVGGTLPRIGTFTHISPNLQVSGNIIKKTAANNWDGGLITDTAITGDGYVSFSPVKISDYLMAGLSDDTSGTDHYNSIDYAIYAFWGRIHVYESGHNRGLLANYVVGDVLKVERRGGQIYYQKNGETFYVSQLPNNTNTLVGDVSIFTLDGKIKDFILVDLEKELQEVDYTYNVRGWLKSINDVNNQGSDLFSFGIKYNDIDDVSKKLFNGNISSTLWKSQGQDISLKSYVYEYDALNRIKSASNNTGNYNLNYVNYDLNGNIKELQRTGHINQEATDFDVMDELNYDYVGNQLLNVSDGSSVSFGFNDGNINTSTDPANANNDYSYDTNGNMVADKNKGIIDIRYNHLNLPTQIKFDNGSTISYIYDANGVKLEKEVDDALYSGAVYTYYAGNYIYKRGNSHGQSEIRLTFFNTEEGYVQPVIQSTNTGGSTISIGFDGINLPKEIITGFEYTYQYKDHLGNIRLSYQDIDGDGVIEPSIEIKEENHYYPFGLKHKGYNNQIIGRDHNYGFGGKEEQDELGLAWVDITARNYDPSLGRWMNIDPLASGYTPISTYAYVANNPIRNFDPDGKRIGDGIEKFNSYRNSVNNRITSIRNTINNRTERVNNRVQRLRKRGKDKKADALLEKLDADNSNSQSEIDFLSEIDNELQTLSDSDQVYNIYGGSGNSHGEGSTQFNVTSGEVDIYIGSGSDAEASHEFTHAYQFETGKLSFDKTGRRGGALYDLVDEFEAYQRSNYFGYEIQYTSIEQISKSPSYRSIRSRNIQLTLETNNSGFEGGANIRTQLKGVTEKEGRNSTVPTNYYKDWRLDYVSGMLSN